MKIKYYLRGLGIGILVTAVIMGLTSGKTREMTDEEVKARAKQLGMVENMMLSDIQNTQSPETEPTKKPDENKLPVESEPAETKPEESRPAETIPKESEPEDKLPEKTEEPKDIPESKPDTNPDEGSLITIIISSGQSSVSVSKMLEDAGLVENASDYDKYLCDNGYDKKIRTGTYEIPKGLSDEDIAEMIMGR